MWNSYLEINGKIIVKFFILFYFLYVFVWCDGRLVMKILFTLS